MEKSRPTPVVSLINLHEELHSSYEVLRKTMRWPEADLRFTVYGHRISIVKNIIYCKIFERDQLSNIDWHVKTLPFKPPIDPDISIIMQRFDSFLQVSLITNYFTSIENFFRIIADRLYPNLFNEHTPISTIYNRIFEEFDCKNYTCVFDMYRLLRNLSHNNGIYNNEEKRFFYDNRVYYFIPGKHVYINWLFLSNLSIDIDRCVFKIINTKPVTELSEIKDPSSYYLI